MNAAKTRGEREEGISSDTDCDQDSEVSFMGDTVEDLDKSEIEDWIEYLKRSTRQAEQKIRTANIPFWIITHKNIKWRLAMRLSSQAKTRWSKKAAKWNPGLSSGCKASRAVGNP